MNIVRKKCVKRKNYMEASEPKWVNPVLNTIRVNWLRLGGLHTFQYSFAMISHNKRQNLIICDPCKRNTIRYIDIRLKWNTHNLYEYIKYTDYDNYN